MNKKTIITILLALAAMTSIVAQDMIKTATAPISFSKKDFADTIKIKVLDGAVIVPVEIEGQTRNLLFDTGSPLGLWNGQKEDWMKKITDGCIYLTYGSAECADRLINGIDRFTDRINGILDRIDG